MKKSAGLIATISLLLSLMGLTGAWTFYQHLTQLRGEVENTFALRDELVKKFVALHSDQVHTMRNLVADRFRVALQRPAPDINAQLLPGGRNWLLADPDHQLAGTLTGEGALPLADETRREIHAALGIDPQVNAALDSNEDVAWLYYVSAQRFMYLAPRVQASPIDFNTSIYTRGYWRDSVPEANPARRLTLQGPYQDQGGKGWVLTFALPVYEESQFLGVAALDLKVTTLEKLTSVGAAIGESMLITENEQLIARHGGFVPDEFIHAPVTRQIIDWRTDASGDLWLSSPIVDNELWLVHRVNRGSLLWAASIDALATWIVILLLGIAVLMGLRLRVALADISRLTNVDALTQLLNRRGFYEKTAILLEFARRKAHPLAVLIMDIDHFKRINDTHGHAVGDQVLRQIGEYLSGARRPMDLACRWGGEEFVLLIMLDEPSQARGVAERMRQQAQLTRVGPGNEPLTLSGGLVIMTADESIDNAIRRADEYLYQAKSSGRNRIQAEPGLDSPADAVRARNDVAPES